MDNKYGHLFTAEDMLAFAAIVRDSGAFDSEVLDELLDDFQGSFPKDEPLFLLRGQDRRALPCIRNYRTMIVYNEKHSPAPGVASGLDSVVAQFEDFKRDYPDRMKEPD